MMAGFDEQFWNNDDRLGLFSVIFLLLHRMAVERSDKVVEQQESGKDK
jgi:hypothetical protein